MLFFVLAFTGRMVAAGGMTNPSAGMSNPSGGMSNPSGGVTNPSGGMTNPSGRMSNPTARMSPTPMMPAVAATPTDAGVEVLVAPVPAGAVPPVVVPTVIVTEPDELRALDHIQVVGRPAKRFGRGYWGCADARAHERCAGNEDGCGRNRNSESTHNDLPFLL